MATEVVGKENRYVVNPEEDCLVVPKAPPGLQQSRRKTMGDEPGSSSPKTSSSALKKRSHHDRRTKKKDRSKHSSMKTKERRALRDEYKKKGDSLFQSQQYTDAIEQYTFALTLDPSSHIILSNRSAAYYKQGDKARALEDAHAAVEVNPTFTIGYGRLACTLQKLKQWEEALDAFMKMLELDPSNTMAQRGIETCHKKVQQAQAKKKAAAQQQEQEEGRRYSTGCNVNRKPSFRSTSSSGSEASVPMAAPPSTTASGLSELSKQLRMLQATNKAQSSHIERLERQLHVMSDLKGISVADVRCELREACRKHADAELQAQVASLRAQLDTYTRENKSARKDAATFEKETAEKTIATLQLRVGELEEMENALRVENSGLYRSLRDETSKVSLLSATCENQKDHIQELLKSDSEEKTESSQEKRIEELSQLLRDAEMQVRIENDRANLLENESEARENMTKLRTEQFNCRLNIQDERVKDLEQQLSSLYAACEILRDETPPTVSTEGTASTMASSEPSSTPSSPAAAAVPVREHDTDSQVARQLQEEIDEEDRRRNSVHAGASLATLMSPIPHFSQVIGNSVSMSQEWSNARDAVLPEKVVSGFLWKLDTTAESGWTKQYFVLQGSYGNYQLSYSEGPRQRNRCELGAVQIGVATVAQCHDFPSEQPHALVLHMNAGDSQAPVLYAGASSQHNLDKWLNALREATEGEVVDNTAAAVDNPTWTGQEDDNFDLETALSYQRMEFRRHSCH